MLSNLFWLLVAPAITAFILGILANAFRTMADNMMEEVPTEPTTPLPPVEP
ncbi:MAG: hypothetical protein Kow00121_05350 [Elainellaceae cyanobacterium]